MDTINVLFRNYSTLSTTDITTTYFEETLLSLAESFLEHALATTLTITTTSTATLDDAILDDCAAHLCAFYAYKYRYHNTVDRDTGLFIYIKHLQDALAQLYVYDSSVVSYNSSTGTWVLKTPERMEFNLYPLDNRAYMS